MSRGLRYDPGLRASPGNPHGFVDSTPKTIHRYEVVRRLGGGGMGVVYLARDPVIGRDVAIKLLRFGDDEDARARFQREVRIAGNLSHPNIVRIYDAGDYAGQPFIAMEYVEGQTLDSIIKAGEALELQHKLDLMIDLAEAMAAAHTNGIVHRDIKPSNLIVDARRRLKVLDFGIARASDSLHTSYSVIGTPNYMAPEQIRGEPVDARCDVFAAGVVMYELVSYRRPFIADNVQALQYRILFEAPPPLSGHAPGIPTSLERLVHQALEKQADRRPQSAKDLLDSLRDVRHSLTTDQTSITAVPLDEATMLAGEKAVTPGGSRASTPRSVSSKRVAEMRARQLQQLRDEARHALTDGRPEDALEAAERALVLDEQDAAALELAEVARKAVERKEATVALADAKRHLATRSIEPAREALGRARARWSGSAELSRLEGQLATLAREGGAAATLDGPGAVLVTSPPAGAPEVDLVLKTRRTDSPAIEPIIVTSPESPPEPERRRPLPLIAAAFALVVLAIGGFLAYRFTRPAAPEPSTTAVTTAATPTETVPEKAPETQAAPPPAAPAAVPPPPPPDPSPGLMRVSIDVRPWGRVTVKALGDTPAPKPGTHVTPLTLDLAPGEYELAFENGGLTGLAHPKGARRSRGAGRFPLLDAWLRARRGRRPVAGGRSPMTPRVRRWVAALVLALLACAVPAWADYRVNYRSAILAIDGQRWSEAVMYLRAALEENSVEGEEEVLISGSRKEPYLPLYYIGLAYFKMGDCARATGAWQLAKTSEEVLAFPRLARNMNASIATCDKRSGSPGGEPGAGPRPLTPQQRAQLTRTWRTAHEELRAGRYKRARERAEEARAMGADPAAVDQFMREVAEAEPAPPGMVQRAGAERQAMVAFFAGDYATAEQTLAPLLDAGTLTPRGHLYLACSYAASALLGGRDAASRLQRARDVYQQVAATGVSFDGDWQYISPRVREALGARGPS